MSDKRITVWVQRFKDRPTLMLQWIDPDTGKRKSKSAETDDEKKAEDARVDLESDLNNGRYQEASRMSWERFREVFEEEYLPGLRPDTQAVYGNVFNLFERLCNPKQLRSISERTISAFAAGLRKTRGRGSEGMQHMTVKVRLQFLHTALAWAVKQKLLPACPGFPVVRVPKKKPQPVPVESFERLLAKADDPQLRALLLCAWLAGLRRKEAMALEWEETDKAPWVDLGRERIWLPAGFVKGVEDQWVALDPELRAALLALPRHGRKVFCFDGKRGALTKTGLSDRVSALAKRAGVKLSIKALRRGFGCRYAGKVPAQVLQKLMRHANIKTTMDYYANVDEAAEEAILGRQRNSLCNKTAAEESSVSKEVGGSAGTEEVSGG
jgi:integrase